MKGPAGTTNAGFTAIGFLHLSDCRILLTAAGDISARDRITPMSAAKKELTSE